MSTPEDEITAKLDRGPTMRMMDVGCMATCAAILAELVVYPLATFNGLLAQGAANGTGLVELAHTTPMSKIFEGSPKAAMRIAPRHGVTFALYDRTSRMLAYRRNVFTMRRDGLTDFSTVPHVSLFAEAEFAKGRMFEHGVAGAVGSGLAAGGSAVLSPNGRRAGAVFTSGGFGCLYGFLFFGTHGAVRPVLAPPDSIRGIAGHFAAGWYTSLVAGLLTHPLSRAIKFAALNNIAVTQTFKSIGPLQLCRGVGGTVTRSLHGAIMLTAFGVFKHHSPVVQ